MYKDTTVDIAGGGQGKGPVTAADASAAPSSGYESQAKAELWDRFYGDWIWRAVECLIDVKGFDPSPRWVANRLGVSVEQAVDALDGLLALGLIKRDQAGGFVREPGTEKPTRNLPKEKFNEALEHHFIMSNQIKSRMKVSKFNETFMRNFIISASRKDVDICVRKINLAIEELKYVSNAGSCDDVSVYGATLSLLALTEVDDEN